MNRLENKVAIITGGNSGIGEACALLFAKEGAKVVITARREAQLEEVAAKVREAGGDVLAAVSYTHLDVYKRQPSNSFAVIPPRYDSSKYHNLIHHEC